VPKLPVLVVDDDVAPSSPGAVATDRPNSLFRCPAFSESPETVVPSSVGLGSVAVETPGFASPRSVRPPAAPGMSFAPPAQNGSGKVSSLVSACSMFQSWGIYYSTNLVKYTGFVHLRWFLVSNRIELFLVMFQLTLS
jgi:hypothetical protein